MATQTRHNIAISKGTLAISSGSSETVRPSGCADSFHFSLPNVLRCVAVALRCIVLRCVLLRCGALRCVALRSVAWFCVALREVALWCVVVRCVESYMIFYYMAAY